MYEGEEIPEPETLFDDYEGRASPASNQEMSIRDHFFPAYDLKITPPSPDDEADANNWASTYDRMTPEQKELWDSVYGPRNAAFAEAGLEGDDWSGTTTSDTSRTTSGASPRWTTTSGGSWTYLDETGSRREHPHHLLLRPGVLPGGARLVRQAVDVRGVPADALRGPMARTDPGGDPRRPR